MPRNPQKETPGHYVPTDTDTDVSTSSSENKKTILQSPTPSSSLPNALPDSTHVNSRTAELGCPVSGCSLVFKGSWPHGYLWRHLKRPGAHGRTADEKAAWENLHKIEHDKLLATRAKPAQRKREAAKVKAQKKKLRISEFRQRAKDMGIMEDELVAQKVAIWEGMWASEQNGEDIKYHAWVLLDFCTSV